MAIEERKPSETELDGAASSERQEEQVAADAERASAVTGPAAEEAEEEARASGGEMDFAAILDQFEEQQSSFQEGQIVQGKVVGVSERGVLIDFGFKSEGLVPQEEFAENGALTVKPGDEVEVVVKSMDSPEGVPVLSRADALRRRAWDELEQAYREGKPVRGRVVERIRGGLRVSVGPVDTFLPGSQVDIRPIRNLDSLRGQEIEAKVVKLNRKRANVVISRKALLEERNEKRRQEALRLLEEGIIVEGQVKGLTDYGAFIDLGGVDGLLHVTDMSWGRVQNPAELFKVGDTVQVKVLKFDREKGRVSLGYKQLLPDPWETVEERYPVGSRVQGKVVSIADYGAFVELEPGVEGLVHVTEMTWSKRIKHPSKIVSVGQTIEVEVLEIDPRARRIRLGLKQTLPNPWDTLPERYAIGQRVRGRVRNLTEFGAFVEIEDGIDGLVHVSDISWTKRIKHPAEVLKKGQEVEVVITNIDRENRRLSLSIKDTEPSVWDRFVAEHKPGDIIRGRVTRFANFGVFVEVAEGLEGLCHISELAEERVRKPEQVVQIGQELDFRILRIEPENRKIALSARAAKHDEPAVDTRSYSTEVGAGIASLGELAEFNLNTTNEDRER
ncbi:30S ribosomal protein S1 [Pyrinomonas methylaliphatogenes]|uniref:Small ribosomal subunit protein bS1 n=1 Tax=Pyrinomonas methylaliphatogenes TaxID=454194 RepID=A0A0B6WXM2_9BACT|nr:30S ribosomal protein S1 [Pyrinomonas methylaliphatogenes]MBX5478086.1 30S ribosomal protein S1 [Pyrinomonas methylaliphatogenes]CDM65477.1 SSU ribosomal protein S1P [Pyrinomonas methylaliphatogenes]